MRSTPFVRLLAALLLVLPVSLRAQTGFVNDHSPPAVSFSPASGSTFTGGQVSVTITWQDQSGLDPTTIAITLNGQSVAGQFTYSGGSTTAASVGTITLASGTNALRASMCDQQTNCPTSPATATYTYNPTPPPPTTYGVSVTPDAGATRVAPGATGLSVPFTVTNTGSTATLYQFGVACSGAVTCGSPPLATSVAAGASVTVTQPYSLTGSTGGGHISFSATKQGSAAPTDSGSVYVAVDGGTNPVSVSPDAGVLSLSAGGAATQQFTVTNRGSKDATYTLTATCAGNVTCSAPASVAVAAGASATVGVVVTAGSGTASGRVSLLASAGGTGAAADTGWVGVGVAAGGVGAPVVEVGSMNPRLNQDRGGCVRAFATAGAEAECFDLLAGHGVPGIRALGKAYAPTFVYNSATATPHPVIRMNVTVPAAAGAPSSVSAILTVDGGQAATATWTGSSFTPGQPKRISVGYEAQSVDAGVHPYTLQVTSTYGGVNYSTTVSDTLVIVNRAFGPFGAGWWLAGLESVSPFGSSVLWIGSDGSTVAYRPAGTGLWLADNSGGVDSLVYVATPADGSAAYYARKLRGGGEVRIAASTHMQVATVNRLGFTTKFSWSSASNGYGVRLDSISLPRRADFDTHQGFVFGYPSTSSPPTSVVAPGGRTLAIGTSGWQLTSFTDPDTATESFGYVSGTYRMAYLVDPRGSRTDFVYHATGHLNGATRYGGGSVRTSADAYTGFWSPDVRGYMGSVPLDTMWAYGIINGPRDDVADAKDETDLWTNGQGAPTRITDALNNTTYIYRDDPRFPEAVTKVDAPAAGVPNGYYTTRMVRLAYFNARGNVDSAVVKNPLGDGRDAVSRYAYEDPRSPDHATRVVSPTGLVSVVAYDSVGNRIWQQAGLDAARRTFFGYDSLGRVASVRSQRAITAGESPETMEYGFSLGNLAAVVSPLGVRTEYQQDAIGRDTLTLSPLDTLVDDLGTRSVLRQRQVTRYDAGDRVRQTVSSAPVIRFPVLTMANASPWDSVPAESITVTNTYVHGMLTQVARTSSPDTAHIGTVTTQYAYDALGRKTVETAPDGRPDTTWYDPAGNVVVTRSRRGMVDSLFYDALNRLVRRHVPSYTEPVQQVQAGADQWYFPLYRDDGTGGLDNRTSSAGLVVPGEDATFVYDARGNMLRADNGDALVRRTYYANGGLKTDTLHIRTYRGADFGRHVYTLSYTYDLEGRRVGMQIPDSVAPQAGAVTQSYAYDAVTGALSGITDPLAHAYGFGYDDDQRLLTFSRNGFTETSSYDADGRRTRRVETQVSNGLLVHDDRYAYEARGKQRFVRTLADSTYMGYSGLGTLARGFTGSRSTTSPSSNERYVQDALGNMVTDLSTTVGSNRFQYDGQPPMNQRRYEPGTGRLRAADQDEMVGIFPQRVGIDSTRYDESGNRWLYTQSHPQQTPYADSSCIRWFGCGVNAGSTMTLAEVTRQYYGADERLRVVDRRTCYLDDDSHCDAVKQPLPSQRAAFEEYRYDALGRRVLVRSRQTWLCGSRCQSVTRRVIWDGDQLLAEIQAPGQDSALAAMEQDRGFHQPAASSVSMPDTTLDGGVAAPTTAYPGFYFGRVVYVHGGGIDHPLAIERMDYSDSLPGAYTIYPHENWKGAFDLGSYDGGSLYPPCKLLHAGQTTPFQTFTDSPTSGGETQPTSTDTTSHCLKVNWPAPHLWLTNRARDSNMIGQEAWNGSLVDGMRDASGQMYMRNRYYDPQSARFTQEDPIGIAGGLNVYGFAGGDPVSYRDPYGLTCPEPHSPLCINPWQLLRDALGLQAVPMYINNTPARLYVSGSVDTGIHTTSVKVDGYKQDSPRPEPSAGFPSVGAGVSLGAEYSRADSGEAETTLNVGVSKRTGASITVASGGTRAPHVTTVELKVGVSTPTPPVTVQAKVPAPPLHDLFNCTKNGFSCN